MSSCTCISQFLIYYRNVTCELEVGNLSWIDSDSLGQCRAHCSMSWSRGWVKAMQVKWLIFHWSLLLMSRWWSIHGTEPHILSGICFSHGSSAAQRLDNGVAIWMKWGKFYIWIFYVAIHHRVGTKSHLNNHADPFS